MVLIEKSRLTVLTLWHGHGHGPGKKSMLLDTTRGALQRKELLSELKIDYIFCDQQQSCGE